jgi:LacI family transcriptional regulator
MEHYKKVMLLVENAYSFDGKFLLGVADYARHHGPWRFFRELPFYVTSQGKYTSLRHLRKWGADGIIMRERKNTNEIIKMGLPTIILPNYAMKEFPGLPNVVVNNEDIAKMTVEHFLERGFKNFGYCGFDDYWWSRERGEMFQKMITDVGYKLNFYKQPKSRSKRFWENEQYIIADWLQALSKPVGILTCNDERGQYVAEACKIAHLLIPDHVAILGVGYDDVLCELSDPPLSSIMLDARNTGYRVAALLDKLMAGERVKFEKIFIRPVHIVTRQSTDLLAIEDEAVITAVRFIRQHGKEPLRVEDVVKHTFVSRRVLERKFRLLLNRSIYEEIRKTRISYVARMLLETDISVSQIALTMGYPGPDHIAKYFMREMGITPGDYRKQYR